LQYTIWQYEPALRMISRLFKRIYYFGEIFSKYLDWKNRVIYLKMSLIKLIPNIEQRVGMVLSILDGYVRRIYLIYGITKRLLTHLFI
jgi:hypothetical protein